MDVGAPLLDVAPGARGRMLAALLRLERPASVLELAGMAEVDNRHGGRVIDDLVEIGLVDERRLGAARLVELNREHLMFEPLRELLSVRLRLVERLRAELDGERMVRGAWLFGSAARGDGDRESDVDLLLVAEKSLDDELWRDLTARLHLEVPRWTGNPLQLVEHTRESFRKLVDRHAPLAVELRHEGIALVDRGHELLSVAG